ncbi:MAG: carbohydrate ABC transporter permease [Bacillota bacterium]|nr:carbohydrate ABC transporter permease [Bacillota bacterium]
MSTAKTNNPIIEQSQSAILPAGKPRKKRRRTEKTVIDRIFDFFNYFFFLLFGLLCLFPFYYLFINTISDNELVRTGQIKWFPRGIHLSNYLSLLHVNDLGTSTMISIARTVLGTLTMVLASAFVGYLVTKQKMWGRRFIYRFIVITMYFNAGLIPWYLNMSMLGLTNNFWGYIIPGIVAPFNIILVKTYIESIPQDLEESAEIDGAGYFTIFWRIILPLSKPILATIAIFGAVGNWNSFIDSMILMSAKPALYTLQYRLYIYLTGTSDLASLMSSGGTVSQSALNAALNMRTIRLTVAMVTILPIILVYPFMQRFFEKGIMIGAVKG